jgi:hypothetical protein
VKKMPNYQIMYNWTAGQLEAILAGCTCSCSCTCSCPSGGYSSGDNWKDTNNDDAKDFSEEQLGVQLYIEGITD